MESESGQRSFTLASVSGSTVRKGIAVSRGWGSRWLVPWVHFAHDLGIVALE